MRRPAALLFWSLAAMSQACYWDRDTLAAEAAAGTDILKVVTGRFERNPPLYYQLRLDRVRTELKAHPDRLELYDDAGAAADRLGRYAEAIEWMARKRAQLELVLRDGNKEAWYRYYANLGTFRAHGWLGGGRRGEAPVAKAANEIAQAIRINPDAHFGRERVQLVALQWLQRISKPRKEAGWKPPTLAAAIEEAKIERASLGLAGIVRLGNAWSSPDMFYALASSLSKEGQAQLANAAVLRAKEIERAGGRCLVSPEIAALDPTHVYYPEWKPAPHQRRFNEAEFPRLRAESDAWHARRTAFMLERLKSGRHPDTDASFWAGWSDPQPVLKEPGWLSDPMNRLTLLGVGLLSSLLAGVVALGVWVVRWRRRKRRAALN